MTELTDNSAIMQFVGEHRFLSNFYPIEGGITYQGMTANTTEHLYGAMKTTYPEEQQQYLMRKPQGEQSVSVVLLPCAQTGTRNASQS